VIHDNVTLYLIRDGGSSQKVGHEPVDKTLTKAKHVVRVRTNTKTGIHILRLFIVQKSGVHAYGVPSFATTVSNAELCLIYG